MRTEIYQEHTHFAMSVQYITILHMNFKYDVMF